MSEFREFPKIPRLNRAMVVTEKIDGTNGCVIIEEFEFGEHSDGELSIESCLTFGPDGDDGLPVKEYLITAQSRSRIIYPDMDNYGFAAWVWENGKTLIADLGPGYHYGEWAGAKINKRYPGQERKFWLFNVKRWEPAAEHFTTPGLDVVPVLCATPFDTETVNYWVDALGARGSIAYPDCKAEGVVVYHTAANALFKVTVEKDEEWKGKK